MDLALDLMAEFVFCEIDRRGQKRQQCFSPLQELQLLEILYGFFNNIPEEAAQNTVFLSLFSGTTASGRLGILAKLVSVAIAIPSSSVLMSASAWMQQLGNMSLNSCKLAECLIKDYFHFYKNSTGHMKILHNVCPQFTANFMTAVAENYFNPARKEMQFPSEKILETITSWVCRMYFFIM